MFNISQTNIKMGSHTSNVTFNQPSSGMMQRSHPKSFFVKFSGGSKMEDWIFNYQGESAALKKKTKYSSDRNPDYENICEVEVLQVLVFGTIEYMVELVRKEDLVDEGN